MVAFVIRFGYSPTVIANSKSVTVYSTTGFLDFTYWLYLITCDFLAPFLRLLCNGCSLAFLVDSVIQACSIGRQAAF